MSKTALYQKYRSSTFEEVVGQEVTVRTIKNAIRSDKVGHAYLFCGPRGTGKTTMARLLAKSINCEDPENAPCGKCQNCIEATKGTHPDIIEINAANETHVEDVRDLIDKAKLAPMVGKYKVYIIDEVHQLSSAAASALLKTLEEPPKNVIFILATTDPQKLLATVISRCQQFNFYKIRTDKIKDHLLDIAQKENIRMDEGAALKIAILSNGGMRDALSIMDQCASFAEDKICEEDIDQIYGLTSLQEQIDLIHDVFDKNLASIIDRTRQYEDHGIDISRLMDSLIDVLKDSIVYSYTKKEDLLKVLNAEQGQQIVSRETNQVLLKMIDILMAGKQKIKVAQSAYSAFEVVCLNAVAAQETPVIHSMPVVEKVKMPVPVQKSDNSVGPVYTPIVQKSQTVDPTPTLPIKNENVEPLDVETNINLSEEMIELTDEDILGLLQICNKEEKAKTLEVFKDIDILMTFEDERYRALLSRADIVASGKDLVLFSTRDKATANRINTVRENVGLYKFMKDRLKLDKMPFAVSAEDFKSCVGNFVKRTKEGTLPDPYKVKKYTDEKTKKETTEEKVKNLFGSENVTIV